MRNITCNVEIVLVLTFIKDDDYDCGVHPHICEIVACEDVAISLLVIHNRWTALN